MLNDRLTYTQSVYMQMVDVTKEILHINDDLLLLRSRIKANRSDNFSESIELMLGYASFSRR